MQTELVLRTERWPTAAPFRITGKIWTEVELVVVELRQGDFCGQGEACGVYYRGETAALMSEQIMHVAGEIRDGCDPAALLDLLPAGGACNAVDCALWELRAQSEGSPVWALAGLPEPAPLLTTFTLGAEAPAVMAERGVAFDQAKAIKLKLVGDGMDAARVQAVRKARPDAWLAVDANQGFTRDSLAALMPVLLAADVRLIEQPFPVAHDSDLDGLAAPIPVAADESLQDLCDLHAPGRRVDFVNIKLDKCGGLTRGLTLAAAAHAMNLKVMVGNMLGTSLSMAPAFMLGQVCELADLDGPLMLAADHSPGVTYEDGRISCQSSVWGWPRQTVRI
jgi:L-alanine-DL-glutamate epimerase-like enolase superfamily enzyme